MSLLNYNKITGYQMSDEQKLLEKVKFLEKENQRLQEEIRILKTSEKELKVERALLNALMDHVHDSIYFKDSRCRLVKINRKMLQNLNMTSYEEVIGKTDTEVFGQKSLKDDLRIMESGEPVIGLMESRQLSDGELNWTLTDKVPIHDEEGEVLGLISIIREINHLKKAEEDHEQERLLLRILIDNLPDYIYVKDTEGRFLAANDSVAHQHGVKSHTDLIGKTDFDFFSPELAEKYFTDEQTIINSGKGIFDCEEPTIDKNKKKEKRWLMTTKIPFFDANGNAKGIVGIGHDITEHKEMEEKLQIVYEELNELNKTKDKFFSIIAHDLKSPFQGLMGFTEILVAEYNNLPEEEKKMIVRNIDELSHSTYNLLDNLLEWSRIQRGKIKFNPSTLNLKEALKPTLSLLRQTAQNKKIHLECNMDESIKIDADINILSTIMRNLVSNSIKFTMHNGKIIVSSRDIDDFIEISVADTGVGIEKENLQNLFRIDKSVSTKGTANEGGTGLGLILCKEMIEMHGGSINVESEPGIGTVFSFTLKKKQNN